MRLIGVFFSLLVCSCSNLPTGSEAPLEFSQVTANPEQYHNREITIKGYLLVDVLNNVSLYSTPDDAIHNRMYDAIDLMTDDADLRKSIKVKEVTCVIAYGRFEPYGHSQLTFDLPSKYGLLHITHFTACKDL